MIYADYAATTPVDEDVLREMLPYFNECFYNQSSTHAGGRVSSAAVEEARSTIAKIINADKNEIYFTSGGTESDNWAIKGVASKFPKGHIITSVIEHHAVLNCCKELEEKGYEITYVPVDKYGIIDIDFLKKSIKENTCLISVMTVNNEIGTIQPISEIAAIAKENNVYFHTDAAQAMGKIDIDVEKDDITMLSFTAQKFFGPKGIGVLYIKNGTKISNIFFGGAQERDRRPGTVNTPLVVGMASALKKAVENRLLYTEKVKKYADIIKEIVFSELDNVSLNGHPQMTVPNILNFSFGGIQIEGLLLLLDIDGICCSAGAACSAGALKISHVLQALDKDSSGGLRISLSHLNTEQEARMIGNALVKNVKKLRGI